MQGKLAFLAGNSEAMTTRMLGKGLKDPSELAGQDFHSAAAWKTELFEQAGIPQQRRANPTDAHRKKLEELIPATYGGEKVEARLDAYAEDMARKETTTKRMSLERASEQQVQAPKSSLQNRQPVHFL